MTEIRRVTVVGAGTMGHGIAQVVATAGIEVSLHDVSGELIHKGIEAIRSNLEKGIRKGKVTEEQRDATLSRLDPAAELPPAAARSDAILAAAPESLALKQEQFRRLDAAAPCWPATPARCRSGASRQRPPARNGWSACISSIRST